MPIARSLRNAIGGLILLSIQAAVATAASDDFNITQVAPGVHVHQGMTVGFEDPGSDDIANIGFIVGEDCVLVVDTGGSYHIGRQLLAAVRSVTAHPVCYVVNTHIHPDHTLGNAAFADQGAVFIGHTRLPGALEHNRAFFLDQYGEALRTAEGNADLVAPTLLVEDRLDLDLGNRVVQIWAHATAHTDQDLSLLDLNTGTLWLGHLFVERIPALDGDLRGWIELTENLQALNAERVIPGNGPLPQPWPGAGDAQLRYLRTLLGDVREILAEGGFLEDALERAGAVERNRWALFDQHHKSNVTRVYTELEWE
mgnify:CR=1 FL=1